MRIRLNGFERELAPGTSLAQLLQELGLSLAQVAVERNHSLVRRVEHATTEIQEGDVLEIVSLVGGG